MSNCCTRTRIIQLGGAATNPNRLEDADNDTHITAVEGGAADGGDILNFVIDNTTVMSITNDKVTINGVPIDPATALELEPVAAVPAVLANPENTLWLNSADGHFYRGSVDLEAAGNTSSLTDNGDGTFTHDDGAGVTVTFNGAGSFYSENGTLTGPRTVDGANAMFPGFFSGITFANVDYFSSSVSKAFGSYDLNAAVGNVALTTENGTEQGGFESIMVDGVSKMYFSSTSGSSGEGEISIKSEGIYFDHVAGFESNYFFADEGTGTLRLPSDVAAQTIKLMSVDTATGKILLSPLADAPTKQFVFADKPAMDAETTMVAGDLAFVVDATADATVDAGAASYVYNGGWVKYAEYESLDLDLSELTDLRTLTGTVDGDVNFGTSFNILSDNANLATLLGEIDTALYFKGYEFNGVSSASYDFDAAPLEAKSHLHHALSSSTVTNGPAGFDVTNKNWIRRWTSVSPNGTTTAGVMEYVAWDVTTQDVTTWTRARQGSVWGDYVQTSAPKTKHVESFDATTSWGVAAGGVYTLVVDAATHGLETPTSVQIWEDVAGDFELVTTSVRIKANGDVEVDVFEAPDERFAGRVVIS